VRRLLACARVQPGDLVIDAGAGTGGITAALVAAGACVIAVELHPKRAAHLRSRFARCPVTVVQADVADLWLPHRRFHVVANPPFGAVTALMRRLVVRGSRLERATLVVPGHVGARWTSPTAPGVSRWGATFDSRLVGTVPSHAFRPPAPRSARILVVERRH
jgi:23S rRNA (adenine-N6)-dimethyltransferase